MTADDYISKGELIAYLMELRYCDIVDSPGKMFNPDELIFGMIQLIKDFQTAKTGKEAEQ